MKQQTLYKHGRQQGIALPTVMVILFLAALAGLYAAKTSMKEQMITADQYRSEQAFSTAQAGVDAALMMHNNYPAPILDAGGNPVLDAGGNPVRAESTLESGVDPAPGLTKGSYKTMFCDIWDQGDDPLADGDETPDTDDDNDGHTSTSLMADFLADRLTCTNPINPADPNNTDIDGFANETRVGILSVGKPDDESGRRTISIVSAPARVTGGDGPPLQPLIARSTVDVSGAMRITNRYSNATVWSGRDMGTMGNMRTFINDGSLDPDTAARLDLVSLDPSAADPTIFENSTQGSGKEIGANSDVIDNDYNLDGLTEEAMFEGFFSDTKSNIKALADVYTDVNDVAGQTGLIWVDDPDLKGQIPSLGDCSVDPPISVILIVEVPDSGKLKFTGNSVICGMVFAFGDVSSTVGGFRVSGAMIATGALDLGAGTADIVYDPEAIAEPPEGFKGTRGVDAGTWKDWVVN